MNTPAGRGVTYAIGVYEIPRRCDPCTWDVDRTVRPAVYRLAHVDPSCLFHRHLARPKPPKKAASS